VDGVTPSELDHLLQDDNYDEDNWMLPIKYSIAEEMDGLLADGLWNDPTLVLFRSADDESLLTLMVDHQFNTNDDDDDDGGGEGDGLEVAALLGRMVNQEVKEY